MLTINQIEHNPEQVIQKLKIKGFDASESITRIIQLNTKRKETQKKRDDIQAESNKISREIGRLFKEKKVEEAQKLKARTTKIKNEVKKLENELNQIEEEIFHLLIEIPNLPHDSVPPGEGEEDNVVVKQSGEPVQNPGHLLPHWEVAARADIIDFETGNKVSGSGFPFYKGKGARLQRALISWFLDNAVAQGYLEVEPPLLVNKNTGFGTGQLPDKDGQMYHTEQDDFYLIPTAEVPLTNMYANMILDENQLPVKLTAYSPCFRREAGSYGKNVRGLNRLHQFDKVEIVQIEHPDRSYKTLDEMVAYVETLVARLGLTYRIVKLCGKDLSFTSALTYDFEVWSAAQNRWLEVSSVSNFESFQANRMKLRFRDAQKKTHLAHTLNGSALALPRIVAALLENNQKDHRIFIPEELVSYSGFEFIEF